MNRQTVRIRLDNRIAAIPGALDRVEEVLEAGGASPEALFNFRLALEELLTNSVSHGFPEEGGSEIAVDIGLEAGRAVCELRDRGVPFDPLSAPEPDLDADLEARAIGGLGVHFVRNLMSEVAYRREEGCNVLRLVAPLANPPGAEDGA